MPADTDPGIGVGVVVGAGAPFFGTGPIIDSELCVPFHRSLETLNIDHKPGAYGQLTPGVCKLIWKQYQREGWIRKLIKAESHIRRDLGMALCNMEICEEVHDLTDSIKVNQAPIAYIGTKSWGAWREDGIVYDGDTASLTLCESDYGTDILPEQIQFSYKDALLADYRGPQALQAPRMIEAPACDPEEGYIFTWDKYQLVDPNIDSTQISETASYIQSVKWRVWTVEPTSAGELVGICDCACCASNPTITLSIADAQEGIICVDGCGNAGLNTCYCSNRRIKLNYATAFSCEAELDPNIEEAIVLLALVKAGRTPVKPCGCDNTWIDWMLEDDPTSRTEFGLKLKYGPTRAGMEVQRLLSSIAKKPHFNDPGVQVGGLLTKRKIRRGRTPSVLRG